MWIVLMLLALAGAVVHFFVSKQRRSGILMVELLLLYFLVVAVGLSGLWNFTGHVFVADTVARSIGWPTGNPFQFEVGITGLVFATLGILCIWLRGNFWAATIIGETVFLWGAGIGHFINAGTTHNYAPSNIGPEILIYDIGLPVILIALGVVLYYLRRRESNVYTKTP